MERSQSLERIKKMTKKLQRLGSLKQALSFKLRRRSSDQLLEEEEEEEKQIGRRRHSDYFVPRDVCEGHLAVYAAKEDRQPRRFVIPLDYLNRPVFQGLLRMAEEEFGFDYHTGLLTIPCDPLQLEDIINGLKNSEGGAAQYDSLTSRRSSWRWDSKANFDIGMTVRVH